jgi:adenine-specific DNA-methyltransferase
VGSHANRVRQPSLPLGDACPGQSWAAIRSATYGEGVGPDALIAELVERVRDGSTSAQSEDVRRALRLELMRIRRAFAHDPEALAAWADGIDVPGHAYEALVNGAERRRAGQFQTPVWAADLMAAWLLQEPTRLLMDPGVGAGRLLFRAAQRREAGPARMLGIDSDPVALEMARVNFLVRGIAGHELRQRNFLIDDIAARPDAVTCNPPYSRHHAIATAEKEAIHTGFEQRLGLRVSRLAGLHVLFLVRAIEVASDAARIAFITPAEWLDVNYGRAIKRFVLDSSDVEGLIIFKDDHLFFEGALTTAAITLIRKGSPRGTPTKIVRLPEELPAVDDVLAAMRGHGELPVDELQLNAEQKWSRRAVCVAPGRPLRELARVRRGIATGCNRFFVISEATRRTLELAKSDLRPCITTPRLIAGTELTGKAFDALDDDVPRWAINCHDPVAEHSDTPLGRYLRWGKGELNADQGYLARQRKPWFGLERRSDCPILFTYMNRQRPRFIRNHAAAVPLNTFLIVEPLEGVDADKLCGALNGAPFIAQLDGARRNYGGGLWKLEPKELGELHVDL